jgi:alkylhydroperoxidase/carboxymuconolactone decarboxylase family protein YurZ
MDQHAAPEAWVMLASEDALRARAPQNAPRHPYDFGFLAPMARLTGAHPEIGPKFSALFAQIMFAPGALSRQEREMIAGVAAAAQDCHY